jgi:serine/threonine protein phosphatase PrpC
VEHNDVVVMASDGVFDNLFDDQIKACISPKRGQEMTQEGLVEAADCIATYAEF